MNLIFVEIFFVQEVPHRRQLSTNAMTSSRTLKETLSSSISQATLSADCATDSVKQLTIVAMEKNHKNCVMFAAIGFAQLSNSSFDMTEQDERMIHLDMLCFVSRMPN
jgi:hypothetical protein